jgi:2-C-methyl-D-erythritol 4-phosphate cytidylyltransferase
VFVVHDAARPLVTESLVRRCVDAVGEGVDGAIAAARVTDTVKQADPRGQVLATLDRSSLWAVQTPQVFRADSLRRALEADSRTLAAATDDASLVEAAGGHILVVESRAENFKVTTPLDLRMAEAALQERC